jgi:Fe-Mn family superoxide dismutase
MHNKNHTRRDFIKKTGIITVGAVIATSPLAHADELAQNELFNNDNKKFSLPDLPYPYDALEPYIDKQTMEIHHSKHHAGYVNNLNKAIEQLNKKIPQQLEDILKKISSYNDAIRNNAGGHYNHSLFWKLMKPNGGGLPSGKLAEAINAKFGSFENFKKTFNDVAAKRFGSGWAWLIKNKKGLQVISTPNQDNPLMNTNTVEAKGNVVLCLDVWEHAYYLKYQNKRTDYINNWWNLINWEQAEAFFQAS